MQSQNLTKINVNDSYYHVNINSVDKQNIYCDEEDYQSFLSLFEKYILKSNSAEILAYCLMSNRFDLLLCQTDEGSVARFMHNVVIAVSYTHLRAHETDSYLVCRL